MSRSTSLLAWLLAPLRAPDAMKVLEAADFLPRARKLVLESFLRTHLVSQLQQYGSWHHTVAAIASAPAAQPIVLPACPPPTDEEEERKHRRQQIARLKSLHTQKRWHPLVTTFQGWRNKPPSATAATAIAKPISVSQLSRANQQIPPSLWKGLIEAVLGAVSSAMGCGEMPDVGAACSNSPAAWRPSSSGPSLPPGSGPPHRDRHPYSVNNARFTRFASVRCNTCDPTVLLVGKNSHSWLQHPQRSCIICLCPAPLPGGHSLKEWAKDSAGQKQILSEKK